MINGEYEMIKAPEEYPGTKYRDKYCYKHHYIWWLYTGNVIADTKCIHHIDEDKMNNNFENLELLNRIEHIILHNKRKGKKMVTIKCPNCGTIFNRERRNTHLIKNAFTTFCSRKCCGKFKFYTKSLSINDKIKIGIKSIVNEYVD